MSGSLLAVDLGIKTGLAFYRNDGRLDRYRSRNFGSRPRLKKAAHAVLREMNDVRYLVLEGGGDLADPWIAECRRMDIRIRQISAEEWRTGLLLPREQRSGVDAKKHADTLARRIIDWSDAKKPTSLRHDAAEAICIGFWGAMELGWLSQENVESILSNTTIRYTPPCL